MEKRPAKFSFWAYGILAIAALALVLIIPAIQMGQEEWADKFFNLGKAIAFLFIIYMFVKLFASKK